MDGVVITGNVQTVSGTGVTTPAVTITSSVLPSVTITGSLTAGGAGEQGEPGEGVPTGGTTGQVLAKNSNDDFDTEWIDAAAGGSAVWGDITGTLSDQTDLQTELDNKLESSDIADFETTTELNARDTANRSRTNHTGTQTAATISDFDTEVSNNTDVAANTTARHTHSNKALLDTYDQTNANIADAVTKKHTHTNQAVLDAITADAAEINKLDGLLPTTTELNYVDGVTSAIQTQIDAKLASTVVSNNGKGYMNHGATAGTARPSGFASIEWLGSVEPTNMANGDTWIYAP